MIILDRPDRGYFGQWLCSTALSYAILDSGSNGPIHPRLMCTLVANHAFAELLMCIEKWMVVVAHLMNAACMRAVPVTFTVISLLVQYCCHHRL